MIKSSAILVSFIFCIAGDCFADSQDALDQYSKLILGYCINEVGNTSILATSESFLDDWSPIVGDEFSESSMYGHDLELVHKTVDDFELLVELKNKEVCWTQASGENFDAGTWSARIRLAILDADVKAHVFDEKIEQQPSGDLSRLTILGLETDKEEERVTVVMLREPFYPKHKAITVQVMSGEISDTNDG